MTEIVIQGIGGRMGHVLCDMIAQREDCRVVAGIDMKDGEQNGIPVYDSLEKLNGKGDVIIDFSSPAAGLSAPANTPKEGSLTRRRKGTVSLRRFEKEMAFVKVEQALIPHFSKLHRQPAAIHTEVIRKLLP